jgi:hypothetical protein
MQTDATFPIRIHFLHIMQQLHSKAGIVVSFNYPSQYKNQNLKIKCLIHCLFCEQKFTVDNFFDIIKADPHGSDL